MISKTYNVFKPQTHFSQNHILEIGQIEEFSSDQHGNLTNLISISSEHTILTVGEFFFFLIKQFCEKL